jgi:hypothetical protein
MQTSAIFHKSRSKAFCISNLIAFGLIFCTLGALAQPKDVAKHQKKLNNAIAEKKFDKALLSARYLLKNESPIAWRTLQQSAEVYVHWAESPADAIMALSMQDTALQVYERMAVAFPDSAAKALNAKGLKAFSYWNGRSDRAQMLYPFYRHLLGVAREKLVPKNAEYFLETLCQEVEKERLHVDTALALYGKANQYLNGQRRQSKQVDSLMRQMYERSRKCLRNDCPYVFKYLKPVFEQHPDSLVIAKRIMVLMQQHGCSTDPLYEKAALKVQAKEPSPNLLIKLGRNAKQNQEYDKSRAYFNQVLERSKVCEVQAECYLQIADTYLRQKRYELARKNAYIALSVNVLREKDVYNLIADAYEQSAETCADATQPLQEKLVYLMAYFYYQKTDNKAKLRSLLPKLPKRDDLAKAGLKDGDLANVGCWIKAPVLVKGF